MARFSGVVAWTWRRDHRHFRASVAQWRDRRRSRFGRHRPILDLRGTTDANGRPLEATEVAIVDEIAGAANLVLGKAMGTPFALLRGLDRVYFGEGPFAVRVRSANDDLFR